MPEASDPTPGEHEPRENETFVSLYSIKEYVAGETGNGHVVAKK